MIKYIILISIALICASTTGISTNSSTKLHEKDFRAGCITAVLNEYATKLFQKIGKFAINNRLDPTPLKNFDENFLLAKVQLIHGLFHGISTIERYKDVLLTYRHDEKVLDIIFPIEFTNLNFTYDYHLILLFMGPSGGMIGSVNDFQMNLAISFDFNSYQAKIDRIATVNTGNIDLQFSGQITDTVVNILSKFTTAILHPYINIVLQGEVNNAVTKMVKKFNTFLKQLDDIKPI